MDFENTENVFIEGESLESLKLLQKSYFGKIKMIYADPPYNTGNDFIYTDDFKADRESYLEQTQQSKNGIKLTSNPETSGRFHSDWISFAYARLYMARNLLANDGVIFASIDDNEMHSLVMIMNEIFGEENSAGKIIVKANPGGRDYDPIATQQEYLLVYVKDMSEFDKFEELDVGNDFNHSDLLGGFNTRELRNRNPKFTPANRRHLSYPFFVDKNNSFVSNGKKRKFFAVSTGVVA